MGNAPWEGTYADEVWISIDTLLWVRHEENLKYADGLSWDAAEDYSEYNVPPSVTAPPGVALPDQQGLVGFRDVIFDPTPGTLDSENTTSLKIYRDIRPYFYTNSYIGVIAVPTGTTDRTPAQHAAAYFSFERNRQHTGSEPQTWEGWTEGQRVIDGKTYPTMTFRVARAVDRARGISAAGQRRAGNGRAQRAGSVNRLLLRPELGPRDGFPRQRERKA